jgi:hypothetical protein
MMDPAVVTPWVALVALILSIVNTVSVWVARPGRVAKARHDALSETVNDNLKAHDRRIQKVENDLAHLPSITAVVDLKVSMAEVQGDVERIEETLGWVKNTVQSMDDYLRAKK